RPPSFARSEAGDLVGARCPGVPRRGSTRLRRLGVPAALLANDGGRALRARGTIDATHTRTSLRGVDLPHVRPQTDDAAIKEQVMVKSTKLKNNCNTIC